MVYSEYLNKSFPFGGDLQQSIKAQDWKVDNDTWVITNDSEAAASPSHTVNKQTNAAATITSTASEEEVGKDGEVDQKGNDIRSVRDRSEHRSESEGDRYSTDNSGHHKTLMQFTEAKYVMFFLELLVTSMAERMPDNAEA